MRRMIAALAIAAAVLAAGAQAITYGQRDGQLHPNVGALIADWRDNGKLEILCTGSLVADQVFLTAGHCTDFLESLGISDVWVTFDTAYDEGTSTLIPGEMVTHPDYRQAQGDPADIAVVLLDEDPGLTPVQLPPAGYLDTLNVDKGLRGESFTSVGYGDLEPHVGHGPPVFPFTGERWYSTSTFQTLTKPFLRLSQNAASTGSGGTCFGDSGGPIFYGSVQVAVTTTGDSMCLATNVDYRLDTPTARDFLADFLP